MSNRNRTRPDFLKFSSRSAKIGVLQHDRVPLSYWWLSSLSAERISVYAMQGGSYCDGLELNSTILVSASNIVGTRVKHEVIYMQAFLVFQHC